MHWEETILGNSCLPLYKGETRETQEMGKKPLENVKLQLEIALGEWLLEKLPYILC